MVIEINLIKKASAFAGVFFFCLTGFAKVKLVVIESHESHPHRKNVEELFKSKLDSAVEVTYLNFYEANGELREETALKAVKLAEGADVVHLSWNLPDDPRFSKLKSSLRKLAKNKILISSAGAPSGRELSGPLSKTVMGKIPESFIIGELGKRNRLVVNSYHGDPMFTALPAPEGQPGSSFSAVLFSAALVNAMALDPKKNWKKELKARKASMGKAFPDLKDLGLS